MFSASAIDPRTIQAYLETHYCVDAQPAFTLQVGQVNAVLRVAHTQHNTDCSAYLTACNPYSQPLDDAANARRQAAMAAQLTRLKLAFLPGVGKHPSNQWPGEASFLVFGLTLQAAKALAAQYEQNAIIWNAADGIPQLIVLR